MKLAFTLSSRADAIGAIASALCAIHCMATPFIFVAQTQIAERCTHASPMWWSAIDIVFIFITFFAVRQSGKHSSKSWMANALYTLWALLTFFVINEKIGVTHLSAMFKYSSAFALITLHLYNLKYCQCDEEQCCTAT